MDAKILRLEFCKHVRTPIWVYPTMIGSGVRFKPLFGVQRSVPSGRSPMGHLLFNSIIPNALETLWFLAF